MKNAMKKILVVIFIFSMVLIPFGGFSALAAEVPMSAGTIILKLDYNRVAMNGGLAYIDDDRTVVPFVESDRTLVPLRFVSEAFGGEVSWNGETRVINIEINKRKIFCQIDNYTMYIDSVPQQIDAPPRIYNGKTFIPLRALAECLYKNVCFESGWIAITDSSVKWEDMRAEDRHAVYDSILDGSFGDDISETPIEVPSVYDSYFKGNPVSTNAYLQNGRVVIPNNIVKDAAYKKFNELLLEKGIKVKRLEQPLILSESDILYSMEITGSKGIKLVEISDNVADFAMGQRFALVLKKDGSLFARTDIESGEAYMTTSDFIPTTLSAIDFDIDKRVIRGRSIKNLAKEVKAIFAGRETCFAIKKDGTLWAWGSNLKGKLGDGTEIDKTADEPVEIKGIPEPQFIASATNHTLCIDKDGYLWGWGLNAESELTSEFPALTKTPRRFNGINNVKYVATASDYTIVLKNDGTVWVAGDNDRGKLGVAGIRRATTFTQVQGLSDIVYVKANDHHFLTGNSSAVNKSGELFTWGSALPTISANYSGIDTVKITKTGVMLDVSAALNP